MTPVLDASGLAYDYPDGTRAVSGVGLTISAGERVALVGPNGAGKSTLLSLLGGLMDPSDGHVTYFGEHRSADDLRDRIAVVTQHPTEYLFNPTVREELRYGPAQLDVPESEADERVRSVAAELAVTDLLEKPPERLSGGEARRVALASALTVDPDVLLVDEPVADVDATHRERIQSVLDDRAAAGVTLLVSTPDVDRVPRLADRVVLLDGEGAVAADGPAERVLRDRETLAACGLEPPRLVSLFDRAGLDRPPVTMDAAVERLRELDGE